MATYIPSPETLNSALAAGANHLNATIKPIELSAPVKEVEDRFVEIPSDLLKAKMSEMANLIKAHLGLEVEDKAPILKTKEEVIIPGGDENSQAMKNAIEELGKEAVFKDLGALLKSEIKDNTEQKQSSIGSVAMETSPKNTSFNKVEEVKEERTEKKQSHVERLKQERSGKSVTGKEDSKSR